MQPLGGAELHHGDVVPLTVVVDPLKTPYHPLQPRPRLPVSFVILLVRKLQLVHESQRNNLALALTAVQ